MSSGSLLTRLEEQAVFCRPSCRFIIINLNNESFPCNRSRIKLVVLTQRRKVLIMSVKKKSSLLKKSFFDLLSKKANLTRLSLKTEILTLLESVPKMR